jgi:hypothetical protein
MSFLFDSSNSIYFKKAQTDPTDDANASPAQPSSNVQKYDPKKDLDLELAKQQDTKSLEDVQTYESERFYDRAIMRSFGASESDLKKIEAIAKNNNIPPKTLYQLIRFSSDSATASSLPVLEWFIVYSQVYFNTRSINLVEELSKSATELISKNVNIPLLDILKSISIKQSSPFLEDINSFFENNEDRQTFKRMVGLALATPQDAEDKAYFAYQSAMDAKNKSYQMTQIAKGLIKMLGSAPFLQQEARALDYMRQFYLGANQAAGIRAWRDVFRTLNLGQTLVNEGKSMLVDSSQPIQEKKASLTKIIRLAQNQEYAQLQKQWSDVSSKLKIKYPTYLNQFSTIDQAINGMVTAQNSENGQNQNLLNQSQQQLLSVVEQIPEIKAGYQTAQQAELKKLEQTGEQPSGQRTAQSEAEKAGRSFGNVAGSIGPALTSLATVATSIVSEDYRSTLSAVGNFILYLMNVGRQAGGTAKSGELDQAQQTAFNQATVTLHNVSGQAQELNKLDQMIKNFEQNKDKYEKLAESTAGTAVKLNRSDSSTPAVVGDEFQVYSQYKTLIDKIRVTLAAYDKYIAIIKASLQNKIINKPKPANFTGTDDDWIRFGQQASNILQTKIADRQEINNMYIKLYGISTIIDKIVKQNKILQEFTAIDEEAKGISQVLGPGAIQQVMLGDGGIIDRVQNILQLQKEAKNVLINKINQLKSGSAKPGAPT